MTKMEDLEKMHAVDIDELMDIGDVKINTALPKEERILDYIKQIKNPYLCRCGNLVIESVFAETDITLNDRLKQHFKMM